jgi:dUTPase
MFKVLDEVCEPRRGTKYSAYVDLFAREDVVIGAGETKVVKLGVKLDLEKIKENWIKKSGLIFEPIEAKKSLIEFGFNHFLKSHYLEVALRSSLAVKGLIIANGIGIIDLDYPDEIGLIVHNPISLDDAFYASQNRSTFGFKISKGDKVAQCTLKEHKGFLMGYESVVVRDGGFGSTGN